jgi:putative DNA primase/helicase
MNAPLEQALTAVSFVDPLPEVPAVMKEKSQWVRWKLEPGANGKPTKIPYQINGAKASSTNPNTWTDYRTAVEGVKINGSGGVGFVVTSGIVGFDLDGCRDPKTGNVAEWADRIIELLDSYTEITPSLTGLRVWVRGEAVGKDHVFNLNPAVGYGDKVKIEVFHEARYFTVTGDSYYEDAGDVETRNLVAAYKLLHDIREQYPAPSNTGDVKADAGEPTKIELLGTFGTSKYDIFTKGEIESQSPFVISNRVGKLTYPSQSEADMAFTTVLAIKYEGDAEKVDESFRQSPLMRDKWLRDDYRENTIKRACETASKLKAKAVKSETSERLQPTPNLEVRDVQEPEPPSLVLPRSVLGSSYLGKLYDEVFAPNDWPLEIALPAVVTAASVVIPQPSYDGTGIQLRGDMKTSLYTALIAPVHSGKSQVIEWAAKSLGIYHDTRDKHYTQVKFGSAEQMWKYLFKHSVMNDQQDPKAFSRAVLVNPDELSHVMAKAGIPDATLASTLTTAFYNRRHIITLGGQGGGRDITIPFPFSIIGGIVQEDFDSVFDASSLGGLYDRFLFGLAPEGFNWSYRSFPVDHPFFQSKPSPVVTIAHPSLEEVIKHWNQRDKELGRIVEVCVRVAAVFAAIDGRMTVTGEDLEKLWPLAQYQKAIRSMYKPNPGMNPDAIYANVAMNWVQANAQQWRTLRDLQKGTNYHRRKLGPNVAFRSIQALARDSQIEAWVSTADGGGTLNPLPADYTGKRPKIGGALIRLAGSQGD